MTDKRCGTCGWWEVIGEADDRGECTVPVPSSLPSDDRVWTGDDEGADCPCWKEKGDE
jgi:hypothetical protein